MEINERLVRYFAFLYKSGGRDGKSASYETIKSNVKPLGALGLRFGKMDEAAISKDDFDYFFVRLADDKSINTAHQYRNLLLAFFRFATQERKEFRLEPLDTISDYLEGTRRHREKAVPNEYYDDDVFTARCEGLKPKYLLIAHLAAYAGLRVHEVLHLKGRDVRTDGLIIRKAGGTKSGNSKEIAWCSRWLLAELETHRRKNQIQPEGYFFRSSHFPRRPITANRVNQEFKGRFKPHELRAWFAATLALGNVKPEIIRQRMRHGDLDVSALYVRKFNVNMMQMEPIKDETLRRLGVLPAHQFRPMGSPDVITPEEAFIEEAVAI